MENFIVSARKYRPTTFESVVGQQSITQTLQNAIKNNHLAQALLFCGPRGVGKTTCARILAKAINLSDRDVEVSLENNEEDFSFNIFELDAASNNSVEDIRNLIDQVRFPPQIGKFKVYIIDEVHMLSQAAFNAFLKTLEEPPKHAIFILATTEKHKIIPTILSRCQIFDFNRIQIDDIANHLARIAEKEGIEAEIDALHIIAQKADGALRDALSMFDQIVSYSGNTVTYKSVIDNLNILDYDYYFKVTNAVLESNIPAALLIFNEILMHGFDGHNFIVGLEQHFRNLLVCHDASTLQLLEVGATIKDKYKQQAGSTTVQQLLSYLEICNRCDVAYKNSKNQRLSVELALMQLCSVSQGNVLADTSKKKSSLAPPASEAPSQPVKTQVVEEKAVSEVQADEQVETVQSETVSPEPQDEIVVTETVNEQLPAADTHTEEEPAQEAPSAPKPVTEDPATKKQETMKWQQNTFKGKVSSSFSISDYVEEKEVKKEEGADAGPANDLPESEFTIEEFMNVWKEMAQDAEKERNTILASILNKEPVLKENFVVELVLDNKAQEEEFDVEKMNMQERLRNALNNFKISLAVTINKEETKKKAYTATEKFNKMAEKNPHLNTLRDQLGLEINL